MSGHHTGSCLCGAVRFRIEGEFERFYLCHCSHCRKDTGSAHAANLFSATARVQWLTGGDKVTTYTLPATRHARCFCPICGSVLPHAAGQFLAVPAGSLDSDVRRRPDAHIFVASRASWDKALEDIPAHETFPA